MLDSKQNKNSMNTNSKNTERKPEKLEAKGRGESKPNKDAIKSQGKNPTPNKK